VVSAVTLVSSVHASLASTSWRCASTSRHSGGTANCQGVAEQASSSSPAISADGNLAAFTSACAFQLAPTEAADTNGVNDVFLRDIAAQTTTRISVGEGGAQANGASLHLGMSDDGRYVLFSSVATNLVPGDQNAAADIFVRDRIAGTTTRVSVAADHGELARGAGTASMSGDGRFVVFTTRTNTALSDRNTNVLDVYGSSSATDLAPPRGVL
jgi:Tol biopolymer transport system component